MYAFYKRTEVHVTCQHKYIRGVPAGTPLVTVLAGFCNTITEHIIRHMAVLYVVHFIY